MPLTPFQKTIARHLAVNRSPESHLAGGAALHRGNDTPRMSNDLDYFHDSDEAAGAAFQADSKTLKQFGCDVAVKLSQPGFVRAVVSRGADSTKVEWAADSAWRFFPAMADPEVGYVLHPLDLAVNKVLALVGRDEPRDFIDVLYVHQKFLTLGALCWAAAGKDPGYSPVLILDLLARKSHYREEQFENLKLVTKPDIAALKETWRNALSEARSLVSRLPAGEIGCLYYSNSSGRFVTPGESMSGMTRHYGALGGCVPEIGERAMIAGDADALKYLREARPLPEIKKGASRRPARQ